MDMIEMKEELLEVNGGFTVIAPITPASTAVVVAVGIFALGKKKKWW